MTPKILVANWKANPATTDEAEALFRSTAEAAEKNPEVTVIICPPVIFFESLIKLRRPPNAYLGAQDVGQDAGGPHTGQVTGRMLRSFGVSHVLIGHSERRAAGDTDEIINLKLKAALTCGIVPVLLVGENEKNNALRTDTLVDQLSRALDGVSAEDASRILYVYEPSWAISTRLRGQADTPQSALEAIGIMRNIISRLYSSGHWPLNISRFLYGGSVNETNIVDFLKHREISGAVVGGASLRSDEFAKIISLCETSAN